MDTQFYDLKVKEVIKETDEATSIVFDIPEEHREAFSYKAGQYLTLAFQIGGKEERRAYSMSSSPLESETKVSIKKVYKGKVSTHVNEQVAVGQTIKVMPPAGKFVVWDTQSATTYYLFGGGSGITPLLSIAKTVLKDSQEAEVRLFYGNKDEKSIIFDQEIKEISSSYGTRFEVEHVLSDPIKHKKKGLAGMFGKGKVQWEGTTGLPNTDLLSKFLTNNPSSKANQAYYVCGPAPMMDITEAFLKTKVDDSQIFLERFSSPDDAKKKPAASGGGIIATDVKVILKDEEMDVHVKEGQSVLDALLAAGKFPPFSCMTGACSTCTARLKSGTVKMDACFGLDDAEVKDGYILTCQAKPTSEGIVISYDDI